MRNCKLFLAATIFGAAILSYTPAQAQNAPNGNQGQRRSPPQEAITACESKSSGDSCSVTTPRGDMTGTCETPRGDQLVCVPEGFGNKGQRRGPPQEAIDACEGKSSGDSCSVNTPRGDMTGTCDNSRGNQTVCVPERPGNKGQNDASNQGQRRGPPQEAVTACEGQSPGNVCSVNTPNGEVAGICDTIRGEQVACVPERLMSREQPVE